MFLKGSLPEGLFYERNNSSFQFWIDFCYTLASYITNFDFFMLRSGFLAQDLAVISVLIINSKHPDLASSSGWLWISNIQTYTWIELPKFNIYVKDYSNKEPLFKDFNIGAFWIKKKNQFFSLLTLGKI